MMNDAELKKYEDICAYVVDYFNDNFISSMYKFCLKYFSFKIH